jgi:hypothetical protein
MPQYTLLIYAPVDGPPAGTDPEQTQRWFEYTQSLIEAGVHVGGDALQGVDSATTVRVRDGETLFTDGPFAETREQLGGYYLIECADLDEATRWAAKIPGARTGAVEVRPVMDYEAIGREEAHVRSEGSTV